MNKLLILLVIFIFSNCAIAENAPVFQRENFTIQGKNGTGHVFSLELALSPAQQQYGLMNRKKMADNQGMIFFWGEMQFASMWMKNTYMPLDMLFFDQHGVITNFILNAEPLSEKTLSTNAKSFGVIELNAGMVKKLGIKVGDKIISPRF